MKILAEVERYLKLSGSKLTSTERKEFATLRGKLAAYGLDPKHESGLIQRAIVFDNKTLVRDFIKTSKFVERANRVSEETQHNLNGMIAKLRKLGITCVNHDDLQNILDDLKKNAKAAERQKKRSKTSTRPPHRLSALEEEDYAADNDADQETPELDPESEPYISEIDLLKLEHPEYAADIDWYTRDQYDFDRFSEDCAEIDQGDDVSARPINPMPAVLI